MKLKAPWPRLLETARLGDLEPARAARQQLDPSGPLADYFYARCLVEAYGFAVAGGCPAGAGELTEAIALLRGARAAEPENTLYLHTLALALAISPEPALKKEASALWEKYGLPHDLDLLGLVSITLEAQLRPWPAEPGTAGLSWPEALPRIESLPVSADAGAHPFAPELTLLPPTPESIALALNPPEPAGEEPPPLAIPNPEELKGLSGELAEPAAALIAPGVPDPARDKMSPPSATKKLGWGARRELGQVVGRVEADVVEQRPRQALEQAGALLARGLEGGELHLLAGMAAEELGDGPRARAHLARAIQLEPALLMARAWLGRVYWREGWLDLALGLWRSLPVEGPNDYSRHYHLALGYAVAGNRPAALTAMRVALDQFFFDTLHFNIRRAERLWS